MRIVVYEKTESGLIIEAKSDLVFVPTHFKNIIELRKYFSRKNYELRKVKLFDTTYYIIAYDG